jgi:TonB family protein
LNYQRNLPLPYPSTYDSLSMGYQALLFCPDEKTARTVTQVLSELEFHVEPCTEPFAAVKKLMGQHFDAVVVDCDNEQNATLLFKSARNSTSNQTSLAVAVVEGQAGVAKAFRIGANLVLTKPINIEQAKGTLRVARGLLRKSDPNKAAVPAASAAAASAAAPAVKPAPPKAVATAKPAPPVAPLQAAAPRPTQIPAPKPLAPAWPVPAAAAATASAKDSGTIEARVPPPVPAPSAPSLNVPPAPVVEAKPVVATPPTAVTSGGAAAAPALARTAPEAPVAASPAQNAIADVVIDSPATDIFGEAITAPAPAQETAFTFGGANVEPQTNGGSKKILLGIAAAAFVASALYFGWAQLQSLSGPKTNNPAATAPVATAPKAVTPSSVKPAPASSQSAAPAPISALTETKLDPIVDDTASPANDVTVRTLPTSTKPSTSAAAAKPVSESEELAAAPLVVKGGKAPALQPKTAAADAPAPSLIGMATPGSGAPPPNFVPESNKPFQPVLQALNISQGVSQGLVIKKVSPTYPTQALRMRIEGSVQLLATISKDGDIARVKTISGDQQLAKAASDAVKQWKYKPYLLNGEPVEIQTQITVNFKLPK